MRRTAVLAIVTVVATLGALVFVIARSSRIEDEQRAATLIQKVKDSPDIPVNFTNFDGVPLTIKEVTSKELPAGEYQQLTGEASAADRFVTFPNVTLFNSTNQRIIKLTLTVGNRKTRKWYIVTPGNVNIAPHQVFSLTAAQWRPDKSLAVKDQSAANDQKPSKVHEELPDYDSPRLWWPGGGKASDLVLRIAMVEFENGGKWLVDETRGSLYE